MMNTAKKCRAKCKNYDFTIYEVLPDGDTNGEILFLHGAGEADGQRMLPLSYKLANRGYRCVSFDFLGHGDSTCLLSATTLSDRRDQARIVRNGMFGERKIGVIAFSMAGHTAVEMSATDVNIDKMVLCAPALYSRKAQEACFGDPFSAAIRETYGWKDSHILDILKQSKVERLVLVGENDNVIPKEIEHEYSKKCRDNPAVFKVTFADQDHLLSGRTTTDDEFANEVAQTIDQFLSF
ncbi:MAG TPA: alpha/beta hydrolase [Chthoniobacterales bacterium]|nr:alpha/beta hydrolase [Chthoniobacterales bacterium]